MAHAYSRTFFAGLALTLTLTLTVSCAPNDSPAPRPLQTPRPLTANATIEDGIRWLIEAGMDVERIEDDETSQRPFGARDVQRISVDGYSDIWVLEFVGEPSDSALLIRGSYSVESYPILIPIGNLVYYIRGLKPDITSNILVAVWDIQPVGHINRQYNVLIEGYQAISSKASAYASQALSERAGRNGFEGPVTPPILATMSDFASAYGFDPLVDNMPHPETYLWVNQFRDTEDGGYVTVASELTTGIPIAEIKTNDALDFSSMKAASAPVFETVDAYDGANGEFDELHTVMFLQIPEPALQPDEGWPEQVVSLVIERAEQGENDWSAIAWTNPSGIDLSKDHRIGFVPPGGRLTREMTEDGTQVLRFWDYDVEQGIAYNYRVYGCTSFGRQTAYSEVVSAVAGDPDISTPDIAAHVASNVPEIDCTVECD